MRGSSLATRLFLSATAWVVVILIHHRRRAVVGLPRRHRARLRSRLNLYLRTLIAEVATPDEPPDHQFQVAWRAAVRIAAVRVVLADHSHRFRKGRDARVALFVDKKLPKLEEHGAT